MRPPKPTRRRVLAMIGGALVLCGSGVAFVRTRYTIDPGRKLEALAPWQAVVFDCVARRIAAPDEPGSAPTADEVGVTDFVDGYVAQMHPSLREQCLQLIGFVEHVAPLLAKKLSRFSRLSPEDQDRVLTILERHDQDLLRGAFAGLKSLVFMGYYRDPRTWSVIGYTGPMVAL